MNTFNIGFQIGSIYHYFGRRLNFKIAPQPCCLFQRRASNRTNCIHYLMSHILKKQGEPIISTCVHRRTHETSQMISSDLPTLDLRALTDKNFGNNSQFRMTYLEVSLVLFILQTRVFHDKLIQNSERVKEKKQTRHISVKKMM